MLALQHLLPLATGPPCSCEQCPDQGSEEDEKLPAGLLIMIPENPRQSCDVRWLTTPNSGSRSSRSIGLPPGVQTGR